MGLFDWLKSDKLNVNRRFEELEKLSSSTKSTIKKVKDKKSGEIYALKILDPRARSSFEGRFEGLEKPSEEEIVDQVKNPNIIQTIEHGLTTRDEPYLLMEYFESRSLQSLVQYYQHEMDNQRVKLIRQAASAVGAVHKAGFLHRDICPEHFLVSKAGVVKLIDFSVAIPLTAEFMAADPRTGREDYMAPEITRPKEADQRIDVFAFGVVAYQICSGKIPWDASMGASTVARAIRNPVDLHKLKPNLQPTLVGAIHSCLQQKPAERCRDMDQLLGMIRNLESEFVEEGAAGG